MIHKKEDESEVQDEAILLTESAVLDVRVIGMINGRGLWTLILKEIERFLKVPFQALVAPLVMILLFYAVFAVTGGSGATLSENGVDYLGFLMPGLVIMSMVQSSYVNTSSSMIISKIQGCIVDVLMPPLSSFELTMGYMVGGVMRGLLVGVLGLTVMYAIHPFTPFQPLIAIYFAFMGTLMLSLLGLIAGIWGDKPDHVMAVQHFIVMPATFLSGSFFSISSLPEHWRLVCTLNPFFYMIDGFRFGLTGHSDASIYTGIAFLLIVDMLLFNLTYWMFGNSRKLRP